MALMAVAFPIAPGKTDDWRRFIGELNGARRAEFVASRKAMGVLERTFLQPTPMGDMVIVTLEGDSPGEAFGRFRDVERPIRPLVHCEGERGPRDRYRPGLFGPDAGAGRRLGRVGA